MVTNPTSLDEAAQSRLPEVLWAQRANEVLITINIQDLEKNVKLDIKQRHISFEGKTIGEGLLYKTDFELYDDIKPEDVKWTNMPRGLMIHAPKAKATGPWWPNLVSGKKKPFWLKIDFAHWKDEDDDDDEQSANQFGAGDSGFDMSQFAGMTGAGGGGLGGLGGAPMEDDSDDEDDAPDAEDVLEEKKGSEASDDRGDTSGGNESRSRWPRKLSEGAFRNIRIQPREQQIWPRALLSAAVVTNHWIHAILWQPGSILFYMGSVGARGRRWSGKPPSRVLGG